MAHQSSDQTQQHLDVEVPGDTDAADIVGRTGEQMPRQAHDDGDDDDRGTRRERTGPDLVGGAQAQRQVMRSGVPGVPMTVVSLLTFAFLAPVCGRVNHCRPCID